MANYFDWQDEYSLGHQDLDRDHQQLLDQINQLLGVVMEGRESEDIRLVMMRLVRLARHHFRREEMLMAGQAYPQFQEHQAHHDLMFDQLLSLGGQLLKGDLELSFLTIFLMDWWISHMRQDDNQFRLYLKGSDVLEQPPA